MGKTVLITGGAHPTTVTGIIKDFPENSQIKATAIVSMCTLTQKLAPNIETQWSNFGATTYILLKPRASLKTLESKIPAFFEKFAGKEMKDNKMYFSLIFEPLRDVYLYTTRGGSKTGNINNVYTFSIIAIFILLIACINFINLTTARSAERAKEVGIRKVVGAARSQLTVQFIGESVLLCLMAFVVTLVLSVFLLPIFNQLSGKTISTGIFSNMSAPLLLFVASIAIGLLAGIYPAMVLSSFKPVTVLKGRFVTGTKGILLRKGLVIVQFTISIVLIIGTIVVYNQMNFMRSQELGFSKEQVMVINTFGEAGKNAFKQSMLEIPAVESAAMSSAIPGGGMNIAYSQVENNHGDMQIANLNLFFVDHDYTNLFKIKMLAGRSFSKEFGTDTTQAMVLNETAIKSLGYSSPQQAIGKKFQQWGREGKVIGVMKDFHYRSLQEIIKPLSMRIEPRGCDLISIKVGATNLPETITSIEKKWKELIPNRPFSYFFLDENFDKQYRAEERFGKLAFNFSILAIFISCLGLLGLAYYSTIQRTKEIGVRKVMGASVSNIVGLLSKDFLKLVLVAFVIASPLAWYVMNKWLEDFAYRIGIAWWVFLVAGLTAIIIALLTVSFQAFKAAIANPVKSLRTE